MSKSVLIAGCGYVGLALCRHLSKEKYFVQGLRRSLEARDEIKAAGGTAVIADLTKPVTLTDLPAVDHVISCQAPNGDGSNYQQTYLEGTQNLIAALAKKPPKKLIWISSTSIYGQRSNEWVDETTEPNPQTDNAKILLETEAAVLKAPFPSIILRLGGIYGPGRDRLSLLQNGKVTTDDPGYMNHIHVEDIARLISFLFEKGEAGEGCYEV